VRLTLISVLFSVTLFAAAVDTRVADAAQKQDGSAIVALLAQKADVNAPQADGTTALMWAVRADNLDLASRLLRAGAKVKVSNRYDISPLYLACVNGNPSMIELLLKSGADANSAGPEGQTPLMTVAHSGNVEAAKVLLAHGAVIDAKEDWRGQTALMWAVGQSHPDMVRELVEHGADVNMRSAHQDWKRQVTAEPREKWMPQGSLTPLLFAARQGCIECAKILVDKGAASAALKLPVGPDLPAFCRVIGTIYPSIGFERPDGACDLVVEARADASHQ